MQKPRQHMLTHLLPTLTQTALQLYCRHYKQASVAQTHGLLRKAQRLDKILDASTVAGVPSAASDASIDEPMAISPPSTSIPHCYRCRTEFSPYFHEVAGRAKAWLCHKCYTETRSSYHNPVILGIGAA